MQTDIHQLTLVSTPSPNKTHHTHYLLSWQPAHQNITFTWFIRLYWVEVLNKFPVQSLIRNMFCPARLPWCQCSTDVEGGKPRVWKWADWNVLRREGLAHRKWHDSLVKQGCCVHDYTHTTPTKVRAFSTSCHASWFTRASLCVSQRSPVRIFKGDILWKIHILHVFVRSFRFLLLLKKDKALNQTTHLVFIDDLLFFDVRKMSHFKNLM